MKDQLGLRAGAVGSDAERPIRWRLGHADEASAVTSTGGG